MASIRKLPSGSYAVLFRHAKKQRSASFDTFEEAVDFKGLVEKFGAEKASLVYDSDKPVRPTVEEPTGPTLAQYLDQHIEESTSATLATKANYRRYVDTLRDDAGAMQLDEVTKRDIQRWVKALQSAGRSGKTIKNHLAFVAGVLNGAVNEGDLSRNPCHGVSGVDSARTVQPVFLTAHQVRDIAVKCGPYEGLVLWLAGTGMRYSEATAILRGDVDVEAGTARITKAWKRQIGAARGEGMKVGATKSPRSNRTVNVPAYVLEAIDTELKRAPDELLFQSTIGTRVNIDTFRSWYWSPAVEGMSPRPRIHDLRHTCASLMIAAGVPLPVIQAHLGHESIQTTVGTYGHLDRAAGERAAAAIDAAFVEDEEE